MFGIFNSKVKTNSKTIAMAKDMIKLIKKGVLRMIYQIHKCL